MSFTQRTIGKCPNVIVFSLFIRIPAWCIVKIGQLIGASFEIQGLENINKDLGGVVLINHQSAIDLIGEFEGPILQQSDVTFCTLVVNTVYAIIQLQSLERFGQSLVAQLKYRRRKFSTCFPLALLPICGELSSSIEKINQQPATQSTRSRKPSMRKR